MGPAKKAIGDMLNAIIRKLADKLKGRLDWNWQVGNIFGPEVCNYHNK